MKVLGTNTHFCGKILQNIQDISNVPPHIYQFRVICKCNSMKEANEIFTEIFGINEKPFRTNWCSETGNELELSLFDNSKERIYVCANKMFIPASKLI